LDLSVVICTYNREALLDGLLLSLSKQIFPRNRRWEVVLVDNNSSDDTQRTIKEMVASFPVPLTYSFEAKQGQSWARNRGIRESKGQIIAFTDDDVLPSENWVASILEVFAEQNVVGVGGRILPAWEAQVPHWLEEKPNLWGYLALMLSEHRKELHLPLIDEGKIWGANMAFRRSTFENLGVFDVNRGNKGKKFYRGDDTELVIRALAGGHRLLYDPRLVVYHRIGPARMTKRYFRTIAFHGGEGRADRKEAAMHRQLLGAPRWLYSIVLKEGWDWLSHLVLGREDAFDRELDLLDDLGQLWGFWKKAHSLKGLSKYS